MADESVERDPVVLDASIEDVLALAQLSPIGWPVIDATAAGFGPVPERVEVTYTPYEP